mmetsp:Transcript_5065/g.6327  ORF Transcript_5065/g.6327 Transcript_5065/m.6327 type:complete len:97 (-) Transcript_5065:310-600(-)
MTTSIKQVQFFPKVKVLFIQSRHSMLKEERNDIWYNRREMKLIRREARNDVEQAFLRHRRRFKQILSNITTIRTICGEMKGEARICNSRSFQCGIQ